MRKYPPKAKTNRVTEPGPPLALEWGHTQECSVSVTVNTAAFKLCGFYPPLTMSGNCYLGRSGVGGWGWWWWRRGLWRTGRHWRWDWPAPWSPRPVSGWQWVSPVAVLPWQLEDQKELSRGKTVKSCGGGSTGYVERLFSLIQFWVQFSPLDPLALKLNLPGPGPEGDRRNELPTSSHLNGLFMDIWACFTIFLPLCLCSYCSC